MRRRPAPLPIAIDDRPGAVAVIFIHRPDPRSDEQFVIADFRKHGLEWEAAIPVLRNKDDDRTKNVFDPAIRGKTDRFVHLYRKPK